MMDLQRHTGRTYLTEQCRRGRKVQDLASTLRNSASYDVKDTIKSNEKVDKWLAYRIERLSFSGVDTTHQCSTSCVNLGYIRPIDKHNHIWGCIHSGYVHHCIGDNNDPCPFVISARHEVLCGISKRPIDQNVSSSAFMNGNYANGRASGQSNMLELDDRYSQLRPSTMATGIQHNHNNNEALAMDMLEAIHHPNKKSRLLDQAERKTQRQAAARLANFATEMTSKKTQTPYHHHTSIKSVNNKKGGGGGQSEGGAIFTKLATIDTLDVPTTYGIDDWLPPTHLHHIKLVRMMQATIRYLLFAKEPRQTLKQYNEDEAQNNAQNRIKQYIKECLSREIMPNRVQLDALYVFRPVNCPPALPANPRVETMYLMICLDLWDLYIQLGYHRGKRQQAKEQRRRHQQQEHQPTQQQINIIPQQVQQFVMGVCYSLQQGLELGECTLLPQDHLLENLLLSPSQLQKMIQLSPLARDHIYQWMCEPNLPAEAYNMHAKQAKQSLMQRRTDQHLIATFQSHISIQGKQELTQTKNSIKNLLGTLQDQRPEDAAALGQRLLWYYQVTSLSNVIQKM